MSTRELERMMGTLLVDAARFAHIHTPDDRPAPSTAEAVRLDSCSRWETIVVTTQSSVYEVIVLQGQCGDVLVRGGKHLPDFRRATLIGATAGGSAVRPNLIDVGFRMEFHVDHEVMSTSPVRAISRGAAVPDVSEAAAAALLAVTTR